MALVKVEVTKGKGVVEINTDDIKDEAVYAEIFMAGLKDYVNKSMSKITRRDIPDEEERKFEAMRIAQKNVDLLLSGILPGRAKAKSSKASGKVMTEARRIAKQMVKDAMKAEGIKVSHVDASEITAAANELIEADPDIIKLAEQNVLEAAQAAEKAKEKGTNIAAIAAKIRINPTKKAAAEKKAAGEKAAKVLSAKQAGMVATKAKTGSPKVQATH